MNAGKVETRATVMVTCPKCGRENPSNLKFCGNCGTKLTVSPGAGADRPWGLALMMISTNLYILISIIVNGLVRTSAIFGLGYSVTALTGLYAGYMLIRGESGRLVIPLAFVSIVVGFASTFLLFLIGLLAEGVVGPVWIFFAVMGWVLWKTRKTL